MLIFVTLGAGGAGGQEAGAALRLPACQSHSLIFPLLYIEPKSKKKKRVAPPLNTSGQLRTDFPCQDPLNAKNRPRAVGYTLHNFFVDLFPAYAGFALISLAFLEAVTPVSPITAFAPNSPRLALTPDNPRNPCNFSILPFTFNRLTLLPGYIFTHMFVAV